MSDSERKLRRLQQVVAAAERIHSTLDLDTILATFLELSVRELDCEGGTIYSLDRETGELESRHVISSIEVDRIRLEPGQGIAGRVALSGVPAIVEDTESDEGFTEAIDRLSGFRTVNTIAFPLADQKGEVIGVLQLVNKRQGGFADEDIGFLGELSVFVALAIGNAVLFEERLQMARIEEELAVARQIQEMILPRSEVEVPGFDVKAAFEPCHETAGDYYHLFPGREGTVVVLMDVSGKGVGAAMVSYGIHAFLSVELQRESDLSLIADRLNRFMLRNLDGKKYATGLLLRVDRDGRIQYVNGGHPPIILGGSGDSRLLGSTALPFGLLTTASYRNEEVLLDSGELAVLYSDGYNETVNGQDEEFGIDGLVAAIEGGRGLDLDRLSLSLHEALAGFQGDAPTGDDCTLVLLRKR